MPQFEPIPVPLAKRAFDIIVSVLLLILLSPLLLIIIAADLLEFAVLPSSRGRIFYWEERISQDQPFVLYKFRIFKESALENFQKNNGIVQTKALEHNPANLTFVGRLLRQAYLDEIPQLINVLKGDMSLVGPRPTNVKNYETKLAKGNVAKGLIKAGLTGFFQSHKGLRLDKDQETMDMEYIEFVKNNPGWRVVLFDLKIILISIKTVLRAEGI